MSDRDTICALSSAAGKAAVAVVRLSGPGAGEIGERVLSGGLPPERRASVRSLIDPLTGEPIDTVLAIWFASPKSFTGDNLLELHAHGGRAVISAIFTLLARMGARLAEPGEFARRAFLAGKLDLTEAEGLADLIDAETEGQRRQAVRQAGGILFTLYDGWRDDLIGAMALAEAAIDFSDEGDVADNAMMAAGEIVQRLRGEIAAHLDDGRRGEILRDGLQVVLAGPPNVGKSSLLNALAQRDAAIVSSEPGTTRDPIEVRLDLEGLPVIVSDTAGLREPTGAVEREGIRRTIGRGREADLLVWVIDGSDPRIDPSADIAMLEVETLRVVNKSDVMDLNAMGSDLAPNLRVSARTGEGIAGLVSHLAAVARQRVGTAEAPVITQVRHRTALQACLERLEQFSATDRLAELAAEDLRLAAGALGRITGRVDAEDVLDRIFARFCIGK